MTTRSIQFALEHAPAALRGLSGRVLWPLLAARADYFVRRKFTPFTFLGYQVENTQQLVCWFELLWEGSLFRHWPNSMPKRPVIFDVGANFGVFGYIARMRFPRATIIGFEPHPMLVDYCRKLDCYDQIEPVALSDTAGTTILSVNREDGGFTGNIGGSAQFVYHSESLTVAAERLDDLSLPAPDFIKMDVDGSEGKVIGGGIKTFRKCPTCVIECGTREIADSIGKQIEHPKMKRLTSLDYLYQK